MCSSVIADGKELSTVKKLAAYLGGVEHVVVDPSYETLDVDSCLCQVDLAATMRASGLAGRFDECDDFCVVAA